MFKACLYSRIYIPAHLQEQTTKNVGPSQKDWEDLTAPLLLKNLKPTGSNTITQLSSISWTFPGQGLCTRSACAGNEDSCRSSTEILRTIKRKTHEDQRARHHIINCPGFAIFARFYKILLPLSSPARACCKTLCILVQRINISLQVRFCFLI